MVSIVETPAFSNKTRHFHHHTVHDEDTDSGSHEDRGNVGLSKETTNHEDISLSGDEGRNFTNSEVVTIEPTNHHEGLTILTSLTLSRENLNGVKVEPFVVPTTHHDVHHVVFLV
jgi:hypothetical protein